MILPQRAPVRPRVIARESGEPLPLEDEIERLLAQDEPKVIAIRGGPGSGKTTALRHLAAAFPGHLHRLKEGDGDEAFGATVTFDLAPWGRDEVIEYLLAVHKELCAAVMGRLTDQDHGWIEGVPELWRTILDLLAANPQLSSARAALHHYLSPNQGDTELLAQARRACLTYVITPQPNTWAALTQLARPGFTQGLMRVLRHAQAQILLAVEQMTVELHGDGGSEDLARGWPRPLVAAMGQAIRGDERARARLVDLLGWIPDRHPMAASLLLAADPAWRPTMQALLLKGAYLDGASWAEIDLTGGQLEEATLCGADLQRANLPRAQLLKASLRKANLTAACLEEANFDAADLNGAVLVSVRACRARFGQAKLEKANLEGADLSATSLRGADLSGALLLGANLSNAILTEANLEGADFSGANLCGATLVKLPLRLARWTGAGFACARLNEADLEELDLPGADFTGAFLEGALLTGTTIRGGIFRGARLVQAGLADVDWEGADLTGADLSGATFHLGSSRCGLVMSPIACEGSRTGFYTDDYEEKNFKAPEQIRKANLRGADLSDALVEHTDFYLVDLRGAVYNAEQKRHFKRCRAIL
jgi:uncharacterized protein YjbI with pentapeptide repeats